MADDEEARVMRASRNETNRTLLHFMHRKSVFGRDLDPEHDVLVYQMAMTLPLSHALDKGLVRLSVPDYQREYLWDKENVTKLLEDLLRSMEHRDRTYCLGSPVLMCFLKDSGAASYSGVPIPDDAPFSPLRAELLDGQQRFMSLTTLYGGISAMILDIDPTHAGALALQSRFVHCHPRTGVARPHEGENLIALQAVRAAANQTTQQEQLAQYVLPLFGPQGPARLRLLLTLVEQGVICANVVAIYQWLAAYAGCALSGLPAGTVQQPPRVLPASHPLAALSPLRKLEALLAHLEKRVTVAPVLLNADELGKLKHRQFASLNSGGRVLSDITTFKSAVHYLANPEGRKSANIVSLADWFQWTHAVGDDAFLLLLNTMRWTEQAETQTGDVSGKMLNVSQLLEYFLAEPAEGRAGYTWLNHDSGSTQPTRCCANKDPMTFVVHLKQWKVASDALADMSAKTASVSNILGVLACAGDDVAPVCGMLVLALKFWVRAMPAAFSVLLARVELLAVALCLATPPGDQNHLRAPRRRRRLADVARVLRKEDPDELKSDSRALLRVLTLLDDCPDGASEARMARALLTDALYTPSSSGRARFMLAAAEASVHRQTTARPSATEMANSLDAARSADLSQVEHILAQKFATGEARDAWRADGWTEPLGARAVNLLGNLTLLPKQGANEQWLNQLFGSKHYDIKRSLCKELCLDQNFRLLAHLLMQHEHWTPADFVARHLGLVGSLAQRWGASFEAAVAGELRAVVAAEAGEHAQLFSADALRVAARTLAQNGYKRSADIVRAALAAAPSPPPPPPPPPPRGEDEGGPASPLAPAGKQNCAEAGCLAQKPAASKMWKIIDGSKFCCKCAKERERGAQHRAALPPDTCDDDFEMYEDEAQDAAPAAAEDVAMEQDDVDDSAAPMAAALYISELAMQSEEEKVEEEEDAGAGPAADDDEVPAAAAAANPSASRVNPFAARPDTVVARSYTLLELHGSLALERLTVLLGKDETLKYSVNTALNQLPEHFQRERDDATNSFVFRIRAAPGAATAAADSEDVYAFAEPEAGAAGGWLSSSPSPAHTPVSRARHAPRPAATPVSEKRRHKKWSAKELAALRSLRLEFDKWADVVAVGIAKGVLEPWRNANSCEIAYRRSACSRRL